MTDAFGVIAAQAIYDGPEHEVYVRIAAVDGEVLLDLADEKWRAVRITKNGWELVNEPPVRFIRRRGLLPLPIPVTGGSIDELRELVNVGSDEDWSLILAWLVAVLRGTGPYPILIVHGEQGSAKTYCCGILRGLFDPNVAPLRSEPKEPRDLMIAATNSACIAFDNISHIQPWLSDALCRLATGGGFSTRELHSDDNEKLFDATRPILLNGIEEVATRSDLLDRSIIVTLPTIPPDRRRTEAEIEHILQDSHP